MSTRTRGVGDKGVAIVLTALLLVPLMVFAAFGVDLASWYSRISYLQKSADAAALAGTVWMPNLGTATTVACASLRENGITGAPSCGTGPFEVDIEVGATSTSLRVTVTDPDATRVFSQVFTSGNQELERSAEAEYNLPIPLGSPLNYFGGDASKNTSHNVTTYSVAWPSDYIAASRRPAGATYPCNVGSSATEDLGYWSDATTFVSSGYSSGDPRCYWTVGFSSVAGTTTAAPPDYDSLTHVPTNVPCNAFGSGNGRWEGTVAAPVWNAGARWTSGTGNRQCSWPNYITSSVPSSGHRSNSGNVDPTSRPCNLGYAGTNGRWPASGGYESSSRYTGRHTNGNQLCRFVAQTSSSTVSVPDPDQIDPTRNPGFWALIEGPGTVATQGDTYSPRCYLTVNCGSVENQAYRPTSSADRGYWYVIKIPPGLTGNVDVRVYDASNNPTGSQTSLAGDSSINASSQAFQTEYRVYQQTNQLDFSSKNPVTSGAANTTPGSCFWQLGSEASFRGIWQSLCNLSGVAPGDIYLLNVRTNGTTGSGINGYAVEACANGSCSVGVQPAVYAYADMAMYNNINTGAATFYLAEVGPQYAGRTLVIELWDAGDASGDATIYPMRPSSSVPKPVVNVPAADCTYTSDPSPNAVQSSSPGGATGVINATPHASDEGTNCAIRSTIGGSRQFNGEWLRIRIAVPASYTCTPGVNPETTAGSCWWGIRYNFSSATTDVTTWQARIEGNPVHLTQ